MNPTQIEQAIAKYARQIADKPQPAGVHARLGDLYIQEEKWHRAKDCYQQAVKIKPEYAEAHYNLAQIWTHLDNPQNAADSLNLAYKLQPNLATPQQHYELGQTLEAQNKSGRAIAAYRRAINSKADFWGAYQALGKLLIQQEKIKGAIALYRQGIEQDCQQPQLHLGLGLALAEVEQYSQAIKSYQTASQLDPNSAKIYYHWGLSLARLQKLTQAEKCYQKALSLQKDYAPAYLKLAKLWQSQGKSEKAIAAYQKVNALQPQDPKIIIDLATIYRSSQQYDLAISYYYQVLNNSLDPASQIAAITGYQETLAEYPQVKSQNYYQFAKLLRAKSLFPQAIAAYQQAIKLDPQFKLAYIDLQYTPIAKDRLRGLIKFYRQIVTQHPEITIAWGNLGDALTQQDRLDEAIECYRKSSYTQAIQNYPYLAKLDWKETKELGPNFIIAGASKSGTSSIYYYLGRHPQVLLSHKKEIDFYWKNYQRGIDWYLAHFPTITDNPDFITGEATPNYIRFPKVAQRIKATFPQTKIIILLRNPADRAISWHYHKYNSGLTNEDLATAIATERERLTTVSETEIINTGFYNPDNIMSGLYIYKIKAWMETLGREQFLILKSEDFYEDPGKNMANVFDFLGLPNCPLEKYPQVNAGSYSDIDASLRQTLVEYFAPYNQQLEEYLGMKFDWQ